MLMKITFSVFSLLASAVSFLSPHSQSKSDSYTIKLVTGNDLQEMLPFIPIQRISMFREYPYLYEGNSTTEADYGKLFATLTDNAAAVAYYGTSTVGFITGVSFCSYESHFEGSINLFKQAGLLPETYYYFPEAIILPEHRGKELFRNLYLTLENYAKDKGYQAGCCVTESHDKHPLKPENYTSIDPICSRYGYQKSSLALNFGWQTRQPNGTALFQEHQLTYWLKNFTTVQK